MLAVFLDIETTGLDPRYHCPVEIAFRVVDLSTRETVATFQKGIALSLEEWERHDPHSLEINGFTWEKVVEGEAKERVLEEMVSLFRDHRITRGRSFFICQNPAFDRTFLTQIVPIPIQEKERWPYHWLDLASMYWALLVAKTSVIPEEISLSKNAISQHFKLPPEEHPHRALNGVDHLLACYWALFPHCNIKK